MGAGEAYLLLDRSLRELVAHLAAPLGPARLRCSWPVRHVQWRGAGGAGASARRGRGPAVVLQGPSGARLSCDRCCTVSNAHCSQWT